MTWSKDTPKRDGWFWFKYQSSKDRRRIITCPARVEHFQDGTVMVWTFYNDTFVEGDRHGGPGLKSPGEQPDTTIRFGPEIPQPEEDE